MATFVGRAHELDRLRERLERAGAGNPQTVLLEGAAGIGKSALLARFARDLDQAHLLTASGDEDEMLLAFALIQQLVPTPHDWADPFAAGADLLGLLGQSAGAPTVVLVDDVHLADPASVTAVTFALRRLRADRVLTVLTTRDDEVARLPPGLVRLAVAQEGRMRLAGLDDEDVTALALACGHRAPAPRAAARVRRHTDGNPLYLRALLDELTDDALQDLTAPLPAPRSFADLVLGRLAMRSPQAQAMALAASVVADDSPADLVAAVAGVGSPDEAVEELVTAGVMQCRAESDGWVLRFVHPLLKSVVYDDLGPATRGELHTRAAGLLDGDEALLHRVAAANGPDPGLAADLAHAASEHRRAHPLRAADLMLRAARTSPPGPEADDRLQEAASLLLIGGDLTTAKSLAPSLGRLAPTARRFYLEAKIAWLTGHPADAESLATRAWEHRDDDLDRDRLGGLAAILAQLGNVRGDGEGAARWADRALSFDLPTDLVDSTIAARALGMTVAGRLHEALDTLTSQSNDTIVAAGGAGHRLTTRGVLRLATDDRAGAREDLTRVCDAMGGGLRPHRLVAMGALAELEYREGSWDTSLALAEQGLSLAEDSEQVWVQGFLHSTAALPTAARGQWAEADAHLQASRRLAEQLLDPATFAVAVDAAVHVAACRCEPAAVVELAAPLLAVEDGPVHEPGLLDWPVHYATALVDLGRLEEAAAAVDRFTPVAVDRGCRSRLAALARVRGEIATARRANREARQQFEEALRLGGFASALEGALAVAAYGRFLRRRGERRSAVIQLESAHRRLTDLRATPFLRRCEEELTACGATASSPGRDPARGLTPQEQLVAGLACRGMTNAQIAQQLVLSVKTVGYHLSNAYLKLGVHSRTQLMAAWDAAS
jgi:ATP/maltotriose-dependent transcriptional regulator MalT